MKYLNEYNKIMTRYRNGEFGNDSLSLHDILNAAKNPELFAKMNLTEIQDLIDSSTGVARKVLFYIKEREEKRIRLTYTLEEELTRFDMDNYRTGDGTDKVLAHNLKLAVLYCDIEDLPKDTEAMLCPSDDNVHLGLIKIQKNCVSSNFSFRHEIIHYFRDVKVGNKVKTEFTRKTQGNTPNEEEQEVNYLTAASIMPLKRICTVLGVFENITTQDKEHVFLTNLARQYEQDENAVLRRLIEVRRLVDYGKGKNI